MSIHDFVVTKFTRQLTAIAALDIFEFNPQKEKSKL